MTRFASTARALARRTLVAGLAFAPLLGLAPAPAEAQTAGCRGRAFVDSVYQTGLGGNRYEYYVQVRNGTSAPLTVQLNFGGFGSNVSVFSAQLPGIALASNASQTIKFGNGTDGNINMGTVTVTYDMPPGNGRPAVSVTACR
ncbi:hypothetical protein ACLF3G_14920 [Falsiroseomonas sp. HC035]|uniref:hypothetical protein n=1 Tax=Falsiroseomonas sp. HC035 TaxID=3390999 RepID=UPI003D31AF4B